MDRKQTRRVICGLVGVMVLEFSASGHALTLWEAYQLALNNDPAYQQQINLFQATSQRVPQARAALLPQINATAAHYRGYREIEAEDNGISTNGGQVTGGADDVSLSSLNLEPVPVPREDDFDSNEMSVTLRQTIFNRSQWVALNSARSETNEARLQLDDARQSLALNMVRAYFDYLNAQDELDTARSELEAVQHQLRVTEQRYEEELGTLTDVHESRARMELTRIDIINAENSKSLARHRLSKLVDAPIVVVNALPESFDPPPPTPPHLSYWVDQGRENSIEVRLARRRAKTAELELKRRKSMHWPTVSLVGKSAYEQDAIGAAGMEEERFRNEVSLRLKIPIFTSYAVRSRIREAQYQKFAADQGIKNSEAEITRDVRSAYDSVFYGRERVETFKRAYRQNLSALELRKAGYLEGLSSNLDLLDAFRDAYRAKRQWLQSRYRYLIDYLTLYALSRTIDAEIIQQLNGYLSREEK